MRRITRSASCYPQNNSEPNSGNVEIYPGDTIVVSKAGMVYAVGDLGRPGGFIMEDNENLSVLKVLALAQGANQTAALSHAKVIRQQDGTRQEIPISIKQILEGKAPDLAMQRDDVLFVPTSSTKSAARRSMEAIVQTATGVAIYRR